MQEKTEPPIVTVAIEPGLTQRPQRKFPALLSISLSTTEAPPRDPEALLDENAAISCGLLGEVGVKVPVKKKPAEEGPPPKKKAIPPAPSVEVGGTGCVGGGKPGTSHDAPSAHRPPLTVALDVVINVLLSLTTYVGGESVIMTSWVR